MIWKSKRHSNFAILKLKFDIWQIFKNKITSGKSSWNLMLLAYFWGKKFPTTSFLVSIIISFNKVANSTSFKLWKLLDDAPLAPLAYAFLRNNQSCDASLAWASWQCSFNLWCFSYFVLLGNLVAPKPWCSYFSCFSRCSSCLCFPWCSYFLWFLSCSLLFFILCDVHAPLNGNLMVPSYDVPLASTS